MRIKPSKKEKAKAVSQYLIIDKMIKHAANKMIKYSYNKGVN